MGPAGKQPQTGFRFVENFAFRQHPAPDADESVGRECEAGAFVGQPERERRRNLRLFGRQTLRKTAGGFAATRLFVDFRRKHLVRVNPDLSQ